MSPRTWAAAIIATVVLTALFVIMSPLAARETSARWSPPQAAFQPVLVPEPISTPPPVAMGIPAGQTGAPRREAVRAMRTAAPTPTASQSGVRTVRRRVTARASGKPTAVTPPSANWSTAFASSYGIGDGFLGGHLACGGYLTDPPIAQINPSDLVVAHRSLPCGTKVAICFTRSSGTYCTAATVRDRGPYVAGRTFDLGPSVARAVHFSGLGQIRWRVIK